MSEFVVEGIFEITGRGPTISRSSESSRAAARRGERFEPGEFVRCGDLEAMIVGVERGGTITDPLQGALILRYVDMDRLFIGQIWTKMEPAPRPWRVSNSHGLCIVAADDTIAADLTPRDDWAVPPSRGQLEANARFIVDVANMGVENPT